MRATRSTTSPSSWSPTFRGKAFTWRPAKGGPAYAEDDLGGDD